MRLELCGQSLRALVADLQLRPVFAPRLELCHGEALPHGLRLDDLSAAAVLARRAQPHLRLDDAGAALGRRGARHAHGRVADSVVVVAALRLDLAALRHGHGDALRRDGLALGGGLGLRRLEHALLRQHLLLLLPPLPVLLLRLLRRALARDVGGVDVAQRARRGAVVLVAVVGPAVRHDRDDHAVARHAVLARELRGVLL